ncbi:GNAT family N-acetyltransferase [Paenibacillus sp. HB172176]|uniref:GNAT family N-acetyltransferase n=1 Tax=Paenibacillus sp. HB172176 TaxID=2493690 RepID=UPI00143C6A3B|nr:GNAT family N-acetyltransferase [Paenibacillus sp. HB172176]
MNLYRFEEDGNDVSPILSLHGNDTESVNTEQGCYYGVVISKAPGKQIPLEDMEDSHILLWGKSLGTLHLCSEAYQPSPGIAHRTWQDVCQFTAGILSQYPRYSGALERLQHIEAKLLGQINHENWYAVNQLEVTAEQKHFYPIPAVYWLAESAYCGFKPLALYSGQQVIGLAVYAVDPDNGSYWIMTYMIDHKRQGRGCGRAGISELITFMKAEHDCDTIYLGHRGENIAAEKLYESLGFMEVERNEREVVRRLTIDTFG